FGRATFLACSFPRKADEFKKIITVKNIHCPDKIDDHDEKLRYETFLQFAKSLNSSGNFYEAQKFQMIANEALRKIKDISSEDKFILCFNYYSNNHGLSIKRPIFCSLFIS